MCEGAHAHYSSHVGCKHISCVFASVVLCLFDRLCVLTQSNTALLITHMNTWFSGVIILVLVLFPQIGQLVFKGMKRLNRIQSIVFETAYNTNENLLICAPTGAGKTNIAMLTVLHEIRQHLQPGGVIKKDEFKVRCTHQLHLLVLFMLRWL